MTAIDADKVSLLDAFSVAFNSNDQTTTQELVTDDFSWMFYEGPEAPNGRILHGVAAACAAVVERAAQLAEPIRFSESERFQSGERVVITYRAQGTFRASGPFDVRAVDIMTFSNGKLATKDTYWKMITPR
jgi:ketosteroid isomerase-like protein